jgi:integrase
MIDLAYRHPDGTVERVRKVARLNSKRGAESEEQQILKALVAGTYGRKEEEKEVPTLEAFTPDFLTTYVKLNNRPKEQQNKATHLRLHLLPFFGGKRLDEITARDIDAYKALKVGEGLDPKTVNGHLSTLRRALVLAMKWGHLETLPVIERLRQRKKERDFLDFEEAERLIAATDDDYRAMVVVALKTGLRLSELLGLRWQDVDLVAGKLHVRQGYVDGHVDVPKNGRPRTIPLGETAITALKEHRHLKGDIVFCKPDGGYLTKQMPRRAIARICKRAGLRLIGWHTLRHSFASHLAMRNAPFKAVQAFMGHATPEMTNHYMHLAPDTEREVIKLLDLGGGQTTSHGNIAATRNTKE